MLGAHLLCSRGPSNHPGTHGCLKVHSGSGQSSRHEENTVCCTCWCSSFRHTLPGYDKWCEPRAHRAWLSARGHQGWSCQCGRCAQSAGPPQLKQNGVNVRFRLTSFSPHIKQLNLTLDQILVHSKGVLTKRPSIGQFSFFDLIIAVNRVDTKCKAQTMTFHYCLSLVMFNTSFRSFYWTCAKIISCHKLN